MTKEKRSDNKKPKEKLSKEDLLELMGVNIPTYKKVKGRIRQYD